jgi:CPA2 family monovalent cation:H+ antiporter-2
MTHQMPLIVMLVAGFGLAFLLGLLAHRLRLSPLVGYLVAGVLIGPFTPGFVADQSLAPQLAEMGVILLMFGILRQINTADSTPVAD